MMHFSRFRRTFAFVLILSLTAPLLQASDLFRIATIRETRSSDLIKVGRTWRKDLPKRIEVTMRTGESMKSSALKVKAYFFDKDDQLVFTAAKPNPIWTQTPRGIEEVLYPEKVERSKSFNVYFALPEELEETKWKSMVVVFGNGKEFTARSRPASILSKLEYPEAELVAKSGGGGDSLDPFSR